MAATQSFETLTFFDESTRCHIPEDSNILTVVRTSNLQNSNLIAGRASPLGLHKYTHEAAGQIAFLLIHLAVTFMYVREEDRSA